MKTMKCPKCHIEREVKDNIIMTICKTCQCEMKEIKK